MKKVLLTGFKLFDKFDVNPSEVIVRNFDYQTTESITLDNIVLDVDFETVSEPYLNKLNSFRPDLIINVGLSANTGVIQLERVALNRGFDYVHDKKHFRLEENGVEALATNIGIDDLVADLAQKNIPALCSNHAGTYLCNFVYYQSLNWLAEQADKQAGDAIFIHIPFTTAIASQLCMHEKKAYPSLPQSLIESAIETLITFWSAEVGAVV